MNIIDVLRGSTFGARVAEEEADSLASYFVETDHWRRLFADGVDVIYGPKGAGKSALYSLLNARKSELFDRGILLAVGENPRGAPAFRSLVTDPPSTEAEFVALWKTYLACLLANALDEFGIKGSAASELRGPLVAAGLLPPGGTLAQLLKGSLDYVRRMLHPEALEGTVKVDPVSGLPVGLGGKIIFGEPSVAERSAGIVSVDALIAKGQAALQAENYSLWFLLDRLDVAFTESPDLEHNALRALFRVYLDMNGHSQLRFKIFLRTDIWQRITSRGFREASHITRSMTIDWNEVSLLNLVVRRVVENRMIADHYVVTKDVVLSSLASQQAFLEMCLPAQVDMGPRKPETFKWMLGRTRDGSGRNTPRELIHLLDSLKTEQIQRLELGGPPPDDGKLFSRVVFKDALPAVSKVRLEQTIYAEYPDLREKLERLRRGKTLHTVESLAGVWGCTADEARLVAAQLGEVGFFELRGERDDREYWVPPLYRDALDMVQGTAES